MMTRDEAISRFELMADLDYIKENAADPNNEEVVQILYDLARLALQALREQEEREKQPQPLTMAELRKMNGETVYCEDVNADVKIHAYEVGLIFVRYKDHFEDVLFKAKDVTLYRHKPKEGEM